MAGLNEAWSRQKTANTNIPVANTYFLVRLPPDTPPVSGSNAPSQQQRSAWWTRPVGNDHILDSEMAESGPSAFTSPPNHRASPHQSCSTGQRLKARCLSVRHNLFYTAKPITGRLRTCVPAPSPTHRALRAETNPLGPNPDSSQPNPSLSPSWKPSQNPPGPGKKKTPHFLKLSIEHVQDATHTRRYMYA